MNVHYNSFLRDLNYVILVISGLYLNKEDNEVGYWNIDYFWLNNSGGFDNITVMA